ncbi:MAG: NB-ARC domain-containing protein [Chloroflexota bacterium]
MAKIVRYNSQKLLVLADLRVEAGLTQEHAATVFDLKNRNSIADWEIGYSAPKKSRRADFIVYLLDNLGLRRNLKQFRQIWAEIMVSEWGWKPLNSNEWHRFSPSQPQDEWQDKTDPIKTHLLDWGDKPDTASFQGRQVEQHRLHKWLNDQHCRLISLIGQGGIGKTALAAKVSEQASAWFDIIIWRSLKNAPSLEEFLQNCLYLLSNRSISSLSKDEKLTHLLERLKAHRCLLVLDNAESILQGGQWAGHYRPGYESYGEMFRQVGEMSHRSCLILTSREKPWEIARLEGENLAVRTLVLQGVDRETGRKLLDDKDLVGSDEKWERLIERCAGHPLLLRMIAEDVHELFGGSLNSFLAEPIPLPYDFENEILQRQFDRLSSLETGVVFWLAIEREPISYQQLKNYMLVESSKRNLSAALKSLRRRSLIEHHPIGFTLQSVILEYATQRIIEVVIQEIISQKPKILHTHALLRAQAKSYLRYSQIRFILQPIVTYLRESVGQTETEIHLAHILHRLPNTLQVRGYTAGNILNLLVQLESSLNRFDFTGLTIRQAYLADATLHGVNFSQAKFTDSVFLEPFGGIPALTFNPDGTLLIAGTTDGDVRGWNVETGQLHFRCEGVQNWVKAVVINQHGLIAICGAGPLIHLWDENGQLFKTLHGHTDRLRTLAFSPDGQWLVSGGADQTVRLWHIETDECRHTFSGHTDWVLTVAFSPNGKMVASGSKDGTIRLWKIGLEQTSEPCLRVLSGHTGWVESIAFSPDGRLLASGSGDNTIRLWEVFQDKPPAVWTGHSDQVHAVAFSPSGQLLASAGYDQTVRLWNLDTGRLRNTLTEHGGWIWGLSFSPDGQYLATGGNDQALRLWEISTGRCLRTWQSYSRWLDAIALSPDGVTLASSGDLPLTGIWNLRSNKFRPLPDAPTWLWGAAFSPDGRWLAYGGYRVVHIWEAATNQYFQALSGHHDWVRTLAFSEDSQMLATGGEDQTICLWDTETWQIRHTLEGHMGRVRSVAFQPNGSFLASGGADGIIRLWDIVTGEEQIRWDDHTDWVFSVAFSSDGKRLVSGGADQTIRVWDLKTTRCLQILDEHTDTVRSATIDPTGKLIASGSADQTVRVWEATSGRLLYTLNEHQGVVKTVLFEQKGQYLISAGGDGSILFWDMRTGQRLNTLQRPRPYEGLKIYGVHGLTEAQRTTLKTLGADIESL